MAVPHAATACLRVNKPRYDDASHYNNCYDHEHSRYCVVVRAADRWETAGFNNLNKAVQVLGALSGCSDESTKGAIAAAKSERVVPTARKCRTAACYRLLSQTQPLPFTNLGSKMSALPHLSPYMRHVFFNYRVE